MPPLNGPVNYQEFLTCLLCRPGKFIEITVTFPTQILCDSKRKNELQLSREPELKKTKARPDYSSAPTQLALICNDV